MSLRSAILAAVLAVGCGGNETAKPAVFELRDVVAPKLAELGPGEVPAAKPAEPIPAEQKEELLSMVGALATPRNTMRDVVLEDFRSRKDATLPFLAQVLNDTQQTPEFRSAAIEVLGALDSPASVETLVATLTTSREPWIRSQCAWRLIGTKQTQFLPRILLRLRYETDEETAVWLADCAAGLGNYAGVDGLRVVRDRARTPELVALAQEHMASLAAAAGVSDGDTLNALWLNGELEAKLPPPAVSKDLERQIWKCIQALGEWDLRVVDDRRFILTDMNAWIVDPLMQTLHEKNVYLRIHAAQCLQRLGLRARKAGPELLAALNEPRLAPAAASALGALGWTAAAEPLESALLNSRDLDYRTAAARALGTLAQERSVKPLRSAFAPAQAADLRQAAAESLLALDPSRDVVEFLAERMTAPRTEAISAENALGRWLASSKKAEPARFDPILREWLALDTTAAGEIATREQLEARLAARAKLVTSRALAEIR
ncbi:MAG TPA: HEAT repeat domain-containing protein [Planctomycetota bacterium]|nr:HEAT repeat domain-containing protein [Planctomycetota bacterium]